MLMAATIVAFKQHPCQGLVAMAQPKLRVLLPRSSVVAGEAVWTGVCAGSLAIAFTVYRSAMEDTMQAFCQERCNCADAGGVVCVQENDKNPRENLSCLVCKEQAAIT